MRPALPLASVSQGMRASMPCWSHGRAPLAGSTPVVRSSVGQHLHMRQGRPADADSRCGQAVRLHEGRRARGAASTARLQLATLLFVRGAADEAAALCRAALAVARTSALAGGDRQQARAPKGPHALARQRVRTHGSGRKPSSRAPASMLACARAGRRRPRRRALWAAANAGRPRTARQPRAPPCVPVVGARQHCHFMRRRMVV